VSRLDGRFVAFVECPLVSSKYLCHLFHKIVSVLHFRKCPGDIGLYEE
jgi:hypothetical protein